MDQIQNYIVKDVLFEEIDSGQTHATSEYENLYKGQITAIRVLHQTKGRGKYDRKWESESKRNILTTLIFPHFTNIEKIQQVPLVVGYSIVQLYQKLYNIQAKLKWVNDVQLSNKKQCGILTESQVNGNEIVVFVGIGLNVDWSIEGATNLEKELNLNIDQEILFNELKETVISNLFKLNEYGFTQYQAGINEVLYKKGELCIFVDAQNQEEVCKGVIQQINSDGLLVIKEENGEDRLVEHKLMMKK